MELSELVITVESTWHPFFLVSQLTMTTICLKEDSTTGALWLHRLRKNTSAGLTNTAANSNDKETNPVVNSKEIRTRRLKMATNKIDEEDSDERPDDDVRQESDLSRRIFVSESTEQSRPYNLNRGLPNGADHQQVDKQFEQPKTSVSQEWSQIISLKADKSKFSLTETIRVKIDRKNMKSTLITSPHKGEDANIGLQTKDGQSIPCQQTKSTLIQSVSNGKLCVSSLFG